MASGPAPPPGTRRSGAGGSGNADAHADPETHKTPCMSITQKKQDYK